MLIYVGLCTLEQNLCPSLLLFHLHGSMYHDYNFPVGVIIAADNNDKTKNILIIGIEYVSLFYNNWRLMTNQIYFAPVIFVFVLFA